jgi:hypothetical protein
MLPDEEIYFRERVDQYIRTMMSPMAHIDPGKSSLFAVIFGLSIFGVWSWLDSSPESFALFAHTIDLMLFFVPLISSNQLYHGLDLETIPFI